MGGSRTRGRPRRCDSGPLFAVKRRGVPRGEIICPTRCGLRFPEVTSSAPIEEALGAAHRRGAARRPPGVRPSAHAAAAHPPACARPSPEHQPPTPIAPATHPRSPALGGVLRCAPHPQYTQVPYYKYFQVQF